MSNKNITKWVVQHWSIIVFVGLIVSGAAVSQERLKRAEQDIENVKRSMEAKILKLEERTQKDSKVLSEISNRLSNTEGKLDIIIRMLERME